MIASVTGYLSLTYYIMGISFFDFVLLGALIGLYTLGCSVLPATIFFKKGFDGLAIVNYYFRTGGIERHQDRKKRDYHISILVVFNVGIFLVGRVI